MEGTGGGREGGKGRERRGERGKRAGWGWTVEGGEGGTEGMKGREREGVGRGNCCPLPPRLVCDTPLPV